ncbi:MAG: GNAT family N-acetyltransferase, partial [Candidatus Gracilibacteria bacterium]
MNHSFLKNQEIDLETIVIETPRCTIEPFRMEGIDFDDLSLAFRGANENFYVSEYLPNTQEEKEFITSTLEDRKNGKAFECFIFNKASRVIVGSIGISSLDTLEPNIGLWIRKEYHGKGYGTEVYTTMFEWIK